MNRWDWWRLRKEHTPFQWAVQQSIWRVSPKGETRADIRAAMMTASLIAAQMAKAPDEVEFNAMIERLMNYLKDASDYEDVDDIEAARRVAARKAD